MRSQPFKSARKVLVAAGAGQTVIDFSVLEPNKKIEIHFAQVTTDVNCTADLYFADTESAATDSGNQASMGPGHVPATTGANIPFIGHGPQSYAPNLKLKADIVGAVTNARIYISYEAS